MRKFILWSVASCSLLTPAVLIAQIATNPTLVANATSANRVIAMAVSPNGKWFATLKDREATIWSTRDGFEYRSFTAVKSEPVAQAISISSDSTVIATAGGRGDLYLIDPKTTQIKRTIPIGSGWPLGRLVFHPKRMLIATLDLGDMLRIIDITTQQPTLPTSGPDMNWAIRKHLDSASGGARLSNSRSALKTFGIRLAAFMPVLVIVCFESGLAQAAIMSA